MTALSTVLAMAVAGLTLLVASPADATHEHCPWIFLDNEDPSLQSVIQNEAEIASLGAIQQQGQRIDELVNDGVLPLIEDTLVIIGDLTEFTTFFGFDLLPPELASVMETFNPSIDSIRPGGEIHQVLQALPGILGAAAGTSELLDQEERLQETYVPVGLGTQLMLEFVGTQLSSLADMVPESVVLGGTTWPAKFAVQAASHAVKNAVWEVSMLNQLHGYCQSGNMAIFTHRTSIESALASSGPAVAEFLLPTSMNGMLGRDTPLHEGQPEVQTVQLVVTETIATLQAAGQPVSSSATAYLQRANSEFDAGRYKSAFKYYRAAYQAAVAL